VDADDAPEPADASPLGDAGEAQPEPGEPAEGSKKRRAERPTPPPPERLVGAVEALLLASGDVLTPERIRDLLGLASALHVREALEQVRSRWIAAGLAVELQEVARGVRVVTRPEYAEYVRRLSRASADDPRLSQGLLETLSIVAYRQPVARAEIERIRGVQAGEGLRALLDRHLVKVVGRSEQPGRPLLYGTTTRFLTAFGLQDLKDLPSAKELARL
jgi:segregation and condensation protein B